MTIPERTKNLNFQIENTVGIISINRPTKLNALNSDVLYEFKNIFESLSQENDSNLNGIVLTGEGDKSFIAGADIQEMADMTTKQASLFGKLGQEVTFLIENCPLPVIACVNGFALGGGCEMALSCDFILASKSAVFGQPEVKLGLIPGFGGTQRLAKVVGRNRAKEIIYSGRNIKADEALRIGLVVGLFDDRQELLAAGKKFVENISKNSPLAIKLAKKAINEGIHMGNREGLDLELKYFAQIFDSEDLKEGTKAFLEKRAPQFTGK